MKTLVLLLLYLMPAIAVGQVSSGDTLPVTQHRLHLIGFGVRIIEKWPLDLSYKLLTPKKWGLLIRYCGGEVAYEFNEIKESINQIPLTADDKPTIKYEFDFHALKIAVPVIQGSSSNSIGLLALGYGYSNVYTHLDISYKDFIFGETKMVRKAHSDIHSIELLYDGNIFLLSGRLALSLNLTCGLVLNGYTMPHNNVIKDIEKVTNYLPGLGYGKKFYVSPSLGFSFVLY